MKKSSLIDEIVKKTNNNRKKSLRSIPPVIPLEGNNPRKGRRRKTDWSKVTKNNKEKRESKYIDDCGNVINTILDIPSHSAEKTYVSVESVQSNEPMVLPLDQETSILTLPIETEEAQILKLDTMSELSILIGSANSFRYTIAYGLYRDGVKISQITQDREMDKPIHTARLWKETPSITWIDTPEPGYHTYEVRIYTSGNDVISSNALTRSLNCLLIG